MSSHIHEWDLRHEEPETAYPGVGGTGAGGVPYAAFPCFDYSERALRGRREFAARLVRQLTRLTDSVGGLRGTCGGRGVRRSLFRSSATAGS